MDVKRRTHAGIEDRTQIFRSVSTGRWNRQRPHRSDMLAAFGPPRLARQGEEPDQTEARYHDAISLCRGLSGRRRSKPIEVPEYLSGRQRGKLMMG